MIDVSAAEAARSVLAFKVGASEIPREIVEGLGLWWFGLLAGKYLAKKHIDKPAQERHEEMMAMHKKTHRHLGIDDDS